MQRGQAVLPFQARWTNTALLAVSQGDNTQDAKVLASAAAQLLAYPYQGSQTTWVVPPSWIVFGQQRMAY